MLERFPLTVNGKVDRDEASPGGDRCAGSAVHHGARAACRKGAHRDLGRVLRVEPIGIHDNFFDLGGASIQTLEVVSQANQAGLTLTPEMIFRHQTIAELAEACASPPPTPSLNGHRNGKHVDPSDGSPEAVQ